jgi:hypothetical protein
LFSAGHGSSFGAPRETHMTSDRPPRLWRLTELA